MCAIVHKLFYTHHILYIYYYQFYNKKILHHFFRLLYIFLDIPLHTYHILSTVYQALEEKGYNPINQIVGYILSEDPTYITTYKNARALIRRIDRDDLLQALVRDYIRN